MRIITMIQFMEEDEIALRKITEWCNEAVAFFQDPESPREPITVPAGTQVVISPVLRLDRESNGTRAIRRLSAGHPLTMGQVTEALLEIVNAQARLRAREPHQFFPAELKARYEENLSEAGSYVQSWLDQASGC